MKRQLLVVAFEFRLGNFYILLVQASTVNYLPSGHKTLLAFNDCVCMNVIIFFQIQSIIQCILNFFINFPKNFRGIKLK